MSPPDHDPGRPRLPRLLPLLTGAGVALLGLVTVATRWLAGPAAQRADVPALAMPFAAAVGFVALGAALAFAATGRRRRGVVAAALVAAALAALALIEPLAGLDLGAGGWLSSPPFAGSPEPGWLAPDSAVAFLLAAAALLAGRRRPFATALLATAVLVLGVVPLLGFLGGTRGAAGGLPAAGMAALTALGLVALGTGLAAQGFRLRTHRGGASWRWPVLSAVITLVATLLFWQALERREAARIQALVDGARERVGAEMQARLEARLEALWVLASLWEVQAQPARESWEADATPILRRYPEMAAVEWLDDRGLVPWTFPATARVPSLAQRLENEPDLRRRLAAARRREAPLADGMVALPGGGAGFRLLVPAKIPEGAGFLSAMFRADALLARVLAGVAPDFFVHVAAAGEPLYDRQVSDAGELFAWIGTADIAVPGGTSWRVTVRPSTALLPAQRSWLTLLILLAGVGLALLLAEALHLQGTALARARDLARANLDLTSEIEDHRRAEAEIRRLNAELEDRVEARTEELAQSNADLKQFATFVSHELRQPLNSLALWTDLLASRHGEAMGETGRRYLGEIGGSVRRMGELISGQLALSDVAAHQPRPEAVDLGEVAREVRRDLATTLREAGAEVEVGALPVVRGDPRQLYQLLRNLVDNAVKYRRPGIPPRIRIRAQRGDEDPEPDGRLRILVEDNGRGFPPEEGERVFRLFERLEPEAAPGSGTGLAICQRVVRRLGGTITAEGRPGAGATFVISLPTDLVEARPEEKDPAP
jgi:signal transduction histidine kinase